ncbi:Choline dehydrogenase or related flavoprotein [Gulbenkiania indica]|uniref:Choline dehydrogenase or related flavoprotein n=1 Tax=Gulbenkiania indica TaxID=375574 RepID=A0A0K6H1S2_9NEIS|nr:GMC family oxidoreductase [Gulbenkiania indica]CUA84689.1 Choline dehydrogenase or related flavoprotein [Gulbenkiania indica]
MSADRIPDPIAEGLARGWKVRDGATLAEDLQLTADVVIVGTGAGGGMAAETLAQAGLDVILLEEGGLHSSRDFRLDEARAYPVLYQESANRKTADKGITILQGRTVGGSTVVNWTTSFRTPADTLAWWRTHHGLTDLTEAALAPWFDAAEARVGVADWQADPNPNNAVIERGCQALGYGFGRIRRNVRGCWNLGYCGMGCPTNAKQSMLVTTLPAALDRGARLLTRVRAERLLMSPDRQRVEAVLGQALAADGMTPTGRSVRIRAREVILAGGAIGTPALLLRSGAPDPWLRTGARTFLHPVALSGAVFGTRIEPYSGAPQTVYSDHFLHTQPVDGPLGYKLEAPPVHPLILAATLSGFGEGYRRLMTSMPHLNVLLALLRDGFHPHSPGGQVRLRADGTPLLDYPLTDAVWDGVRRSWLTMAEVQFAAGARQVLPVHEQAHPVSTLAEARRMIAELPLVSGLARIVSAHVMGGAAMSVRPEEGVVDSLGRHWQLDNLTIVDGSVFPTSIGANPQVSVYAFALRAASAVRHRMKA